MVGTTTDNKAKNFIYPLAIVGLMFFAIGFALGDAVGCTGALVGDAVGVSLVTVGSVDASRMRKRVPTILDSNFRCLP